MRVEDRLAFVLHQELADSLSAVALRSGTTPGLNDRDICLHCRKHQCISVCAFGAITTAEDGRIHLNQTACTGCGACVVACHEFHNLALSR